MIHLKIKLKIFFRVGSALTTMFFALYTIGSGDDVKIDPFKNELTTYFGSILFGTYHITNISILFSMLIAMLTKSFDSILVIDLYLLF